MVLPHDGPVLISDRQHFLGQQPVRDSAGPSLMGDFIKCTSRTMPWQGKPSSEKTDHSSLPDLALLRLTRTKSFFSLHAHGARFPLNKILIISRLYIDRFESISERVSGLVRITFQVIPLAHSVYPPLFCRSPMTLWGCKSPGRSGHQWFSLGNSTKRLNNWREFN